MNRSSMLLVTSTWGNKKTFKMIPTTTDCPYVECIFDIDSKILAIIGSAKKQTYHMLPRIDDNGDVMMMKNSPRPATQQGPGKNYKEERRAVETFMEYYIENKSEILEFISRFAENASSFPVEAYFIPTKGFDQATPSVIDTIKADAPKIEVVSN